MRRQHLVALALTFSGIGSACASTSAPPSTPSTPATPPEVGTPDPSASTLLQFRPGIYRYEFSQTAEVRGDGVTDTIPGSITTHALMRADVVSEADSALTVTISFDSIAIAVTGAVPLQGITHPVTLDSVITGRFTRGGSSYRVYLADSLCAYSQFVGIAQQLLLPELGPELASSKKQAFADTVSQQSCRAGTAIQTTTVRELRNLGRSPAEMELNQRTELHGTGSIRRDSVTITGSVNTRGRVAFTGLSRLPNLIQTESEGTITVRLGDSTTNFRQQSTQRLQALATSPNP